MEVNKLVDNFIELNNSISKGLLEKQGSLHPMLVVLGIDNNKGETAIEHYTIPLPTLDNEQGKEYIAKRLIPTILRNAERDGLTIACVCFVMDAWFTQHVYNKDVGMEAAYKEARKERDAGKVKKEAVLMCTYETKLVTKLYRFFYETDTEQKIVWGKSETGGELMGRFANLWKSPAHN